MLIPPGTQPECLTMYTIAKHYAFSASHIIGGLPPRHPCAWLHGHNYEVEVILQSAVLDSSGFVRDYFELSALKHFLNTTADHKHLNDVLGHDKDDRRSHQQVALRLVQVALARSSGRARLRDASHLGRIPTMTVRIRISEIFGPTIQGEGPLIGHPTVFVRTGAVTIAARGATLSSRYCPNIERNGRS